MVEKQRDTSDEQVPPLREEAAIDLSSNQESCYFLN
jgi:hypothetical protein